MGKARLYIIQFFGILVLLCGYFISDRPDSESVMHFDPNPAIPYVLRAADNDATNSISKNESLSTHDKTQHKLNVGKRFSYKVVMPNIVHQVRLFSETSVCYTPAIPYGYDYLFFQEINPPPPKNANNIHAA